MTKRHRKKVNNEQLCHYEPLMDILLIQRSFQIKQYLS